MAIVDKDRVAYPGISNYDAANRPVVVSTVLNNMLIGGLNVAIDAVFTEGGDMTVRESRIHGNSFVSVMEFGGDPSDWKIVSLVEGIATLSTTKAPGWGTANVRLLVIG